MTAFFKPCPPGHRLTVYRWDAGALKQAQADENRKNVTAAFVQMKMRSAQLPEIHSRNQSTAPNLSTIGTPLPRIDCTNP
jgi:hypothetical protein